MDLRYTAVATARGGREGEVVSDDGVLDLSLTLPKELGGPGGDHTNPEQLFAAGYAACFTLVGRFPTLTAEQGREVMEKAHQVCPYSRATRGNVEVTLDVAG